LGRDAGAVAGPAALRIVAAFLRHRDPVEDLSFDVELAVRLLGEVVVEAAVNVLAGRALLGVFALAEERRLPLLQRDFRVVLGVLELGAHDREAIEGLGPGRGRRGAAEAANPAAASALPEPAAPRAAAAAVGGQLDLDLGVHVAAAQRDLHHIAGPA